MEHHRESLTWLLVNGSPPEFATPAADLLVNLALLSEGINLSSLGGVEVQEISG